MQAIQLAANGASVILAARGTGLPSIVWWGEDPGPLTGVELARLAKASLPPDAANGTDGGAALTMVPESWTGWSGAPGLEGHRGGAAWSPQWRVERIGAELVDGTRRGGVKIAANDPFAQLSLDLVVEMLPSGLARARATVTNLAAEPFALNSLNVAWPVPTKAGEILDLAGRWAKERVPQRRPFTVGTHLREGRHGRTGADAATVLVAGEEGFGFASGDVWALHVAFSGNHRVFAERASTGERLLAGGELLLPGEVTLNQEDSYTGPWVYAGFGHGLDDLASRFHAFVRSMPSGSSAPRPVIMNTWEAVYFDHNLATLKRLAEIGARIGVECFVLDDGWFRGRRDDRSGLGDWYVSDEIWGGGAFAEFAEHVKGLGMSLGLWFEPEMVNMNSDLARAHPDWLMRVEGRLPVEARHQQVLNIAIPEAYEYVRSRIACLVAEYGVTFIKWDHNRDLVDAGCTLTGHAGVHRQTTALYRLMDDLRGEYPGLMIESCASGGARIDLAIIERAGRVWASDCIDPHERQQIQRWTVQLLPPEWIGSHIGAEASHTTGRKADLSFRAATALFFHLGIEWDLAGADEAVLDELAGWIDLHKRLRPLLHSGATVRREYDHGTIWLHGVVAPDRSQGAYSLAYLERPVTWPPGNVCLPGLDDERVYLVEPLAVPGAAKTTGAGPDPSVYPPWWREGLRLTGRTLRIVGLQAPALAPDQAALIHAVGV
jgi:alpha-galactosidase